MAEYKLNSNLEKSKVFTVNRSMLVNRIDPIYYNSDLTKYNVFFESVKLSKVVQLFKSGIGAGKREQAKDDKGIIQIRPTNIDKNGLLKFDKNVYLPHDFKADRLEVGDVLFNNTNSQELVGKTAILVEQFEFFYSNHITRIKVYSDLILPEYLWILLNIYQSSKIFYAICTNWNNQSGIGLELLKSLPIPLPPKDIQQQIVGIYNYARTQKLQKVKQTEDLLASIDTFLLNELGINLPKQDNSLEARVFTTNFSEVSGGRFDSEFYTIYNKEVLSSIESCLFSTEKIKKYCSFIPGYAFSSNDYIEHSDCHLITIKNISKNTINLKDVTYLPNHFYETYNRYRILKGDLLIAMTGATIGKVGIYENDKKALLNQRNGIIKSDELNTYYLLNLLNTEIYQSIILKNSVGGAQPNISETDITKIRIPIPPLEKQNEIAEHIKSIRQKAKSLQEEASSALEEAKQQIEQIILGE